MTETPWTLDNRTRDGGGVSLVDGTSFVVSAHSGSIVDRAAHGLFILDTRVLSRWLLGASDHEFEPLAFVPNGPFGGTFVSRLEGPGPEEPTIVLVQRRHVGRGMREDLEVRNHGAPVSVDVILDVDADFAGLFDVKAGRQPTDLPGGSIDVDVLDDGLLIASTTGTSTTVRSFPPPTGIDPGRRRITWSIDLGAGATWSTCVQVAVRRDDREIEPAHRCGDPVEDAIPAHRLRTWTDSAPALVSGRADLDDLVRRAVEDLGALRIFDPDHAERFVVAAGAPWFMALFGRDSLLASWMTLPFDQTLAAGVLAELADKQGHRFDGATEEEPGRILHEVRFDRLSEELLGGGNAYYGTVDATPLFVMLVAELVRWTGVTDLTRSLMPAVDAALEWIETVGDRDGDGFVEYRRTSPNGLEHQGWKDSWDGVRHGDGSVAASPIALCEVQGYAYAAYRGRAALARALGEHPDVVDRWERSATELAHRFDRSFWLGDLGAYAIGLDHRKRPIASITSNLGHLLWTGIVPPHRARDVADRLMSPELFSGWGIRTLASSNPSYNPLSYHCGSVWPHDTAIAAAGLARYGFDAEARRLTGGLLDAGSTHDGRLPELFGGFDRTDVPAPVSYPTACSPQAWAAAVPLLLVRSMLGLDPDVPNATVVLRPRIPPSIGTLTLSALTIGDRRVDIRAEGSTVEVTVDRPGLSIDIR